MKVFIVYQWTEYEANDICACFDSLEKAKTYMDEGNSKISSFNKDYEGFAIKEMEMK